MRRSRRLGGVAAMSAAALASLVLAGPVSADDTICVNECIPGDRLTGLDNAFWKLDSKGYPGITQTLFQKVGGLTAFDKLSDKHFPGITEEIFFKYDTD